MIGCCIIKQLHAINNAQVSAGTAVKTAKSLQTTPQQLNRIICMQTGTHTHIHTNTENTFFTFSEFTNHALELGI